VTVERRGGDVTAFEIRGHAGFAAAGKDVVCAGISALVQATTEGLRRHSRQNFAVVDDRDVYRLQTGGRATKEGQALLRSLATGLEAIARGYPGYVTVRAKRQSPRSQPHEEQAWKR